MEYFSPSRPRHDSGVPMILGAERHALPPLYMEPFAEGAKLTIQVWLPTAESGTYRHYSYVIAPESIAVFMSAWLADPEAVLRDQFGWIPPNNVKAAKIDALRKRLSPVVDADLLDALGLED